MINFKINTTNKEKENLMGYRHGTVSVKKMQLEGLNQVPRVYLFLYSNTCTFIKFV